MSQDGQTNEMSCCSAAPAGPSVHIIVDQLSIVDQPLIVDQPSRQGPSPPLDFLLHVNELELCWKHVPGTQMVNVKHRMNS